MFVAIPDSVNTFMLIPPNVNIPINVDRFDLNAATILVVNAEFIVVHKNNRKFKTQPNEITRKNMTRNSGRRKWKWLTASPSWLKRTLQVNINGMLLYELRWTVSVAVNSCPDFCTRVKYKA